MKSLVFGTAVLISVCSTNLHAQSEVPSRVSELSVYASMDLGTSAMNALRKGGKFSVKTVRQVGEIVEIVVESAIDGTQFVIRSSGKLIRGAAITAGAAVSVTAVSAGFLIYASGEVIAFVADELTREHTYSRQCS